MSDFTPQDLYFWGYLFHAPLLDDIWKDYVELQSDFSDDIMKFIFIPHVS